MKKKNLIRLIIMIALILLVPLFGNYFIDGWNWTLGDFVFAAAFFFITGLALDFAVRKSPRYKVLACIAIVVVMLFLWVELAVGIF